MGAFVDTAIDVIAIVAVAAASPAVGAHLEAVAVEVEKNEAVAARSEIRLFGPTAALGLPIFSRDWTQQQPGYVSFSQWLLDL